MKNPQEKSLKEVWETEEIRVLVLTSLVIQALLTFVAPCRKRSSKSVHKLFIWILYLLADAVAIYTIGLISNNKGHHYAETLELLALWGSFLLLHLGGPDTITALALEDNELWRRHALQLATQVTVTVYVFARSFQYHNRNRLWIPTVLMFADGFIKYFERTCALFFASRDNFRDSIMTKPEAGPNYARLMEEYYSAKCAHIPVEFEEDKDESEGQKVEPSEKHDQNLAGKPEGPNNNQGEGSMHGGQRPYASEKHPEEAKVRDAYHYYEMYKPLLAEGFLSLKARKSSRDFFLSKCNSKEAFEIIQIELNLIYDAFYTKSFLLKRRRAVARVLCFVFVIVSLVLFSLTWDLTNQKTDAIVTFILFCGAIALDISAATMFVLSDWWVILSVNKNRKTSIKSTIMAKILSWSRWARELHSKRWAKQLCHSKRWSRTISEYNLLKYCFRRRPFLLRRKYIYNIKYVRDFIIGLVYIRSKEIDDNLIKFIIEEIRKKAEQASDVKVAKDVFSARGNLVLEDDYYLASECLRPWTEDVDYDESLMIWHLATDICYWRSSEAVDRSEIEKKHRDISKKLSDYMLYLVIWQQSLLSSVVGMSETRFQDTCEEAQKFMDNKLIDISWLEDPSWKAKKKFSRGATSDQYSSPSKTAEYDYFKKFSEKVLKVKAVVEPMLAKGDKSKSVLFDACRLANQLQMFGDSQWEITSKVWLELLCYAAVRCSPRYHIAQLSKGGELITLVWLYMAHLGLGERFLQNQGFGLTKLVIQK